jgi:hypothetical protein
MMLGFHAFSVICLRKPRERERERERGGRERESRKRERGTMLEKEIQKTNPF